MGKTQWEEGPDAKSYASIPHALNEHLWGVSTGQSRALIGSGMVLFTAVLATSILVGYLTVSTTVVVSSVFSIESTQLTRCTLVPLGALPAEPLNYTCGDPQWETLHPDLVAAIALPDETEFPIKTCTAINLTVTFRNQSLVFGVAALRISTNLFLYQDPAGEGLCEPERFMGLLGHGCRFINWAWPSSIFPFGFDPSDNFFWRAQCARNTSGLVSAKFYEFAEFHSGDHFYCTAIFEPSTLLAPAQVSRQLPVSPGLVSISFFDLQSFLPRLITGFKQAIRSSPVFLSTVSAALQLQELFSGVTLSPSTRVSEAFPALDAPFSVPLYQEASAAATLSLFCLNFCDLFFLLQPNNTLYSPPPNLVPENWDFGSPSGFFPYGLLPSPVLCARQCTDQITIGELSTVLLRDVGVTTNFATLDDWATAFSIRTLTGSSSDLFPFIPVKPSIIDRMDFQCLANGNIPKDSTDLAYGRFTAIMSWFSSLQIFFSTTLVCGWGVYIVVHARREP